jgi:Ice-binding-like
MSSSAVHVAANGYQSLTKTPMNRFNAMLPRGSRVAVFLAFAVSVAACADDEETPSSDMRDSGATTSGVSPTTSTSGSGTASSKPSATHSAAVSSSAATAPSVDASSWDGGKSDASPGDGGFSDAGVSDASGDATVGNDAAATALGPVAPSLGAAGNYAILAQSAITNVPTSIINGSLGISPAAGTFITGFDLTRAGDRWTSLQVNGDVFSADSDVPTPDNLTVAIVAMLAAYSDAEARLLPDYLDLETGAIGGLTLDPGLYSWNSSVTIDSNLTLQGPGDAVWIFQVTGDLGLSAAKKVILAGGAQAENIYWQVAGTVDLGATSHAEGVILSKTSINLTTGASVNGRLLAQTAVTLDSATVTAP